MENLGDVLTETSNLQSITRRVLSIFLFQLASYTN